MLVPVLRVLVDRTWIWLSSDSKDIDVCLRVPRQSSIATIHEVTYWDAVWASGSSRSVEREFQRKKV